MNRMKIPQYIYITENRRATKKAFLQIYENEKPRNVIIVTSNSPAKKSKWLLDFLLSEKKSTKKLLIEGSDKRALEKTKKRIKKER